jgi:hypothetical protein
MDRRYPIQTNHKIFSLVVVPVIDMVPERVVSQEPP